MYKYITSLVQKYSNFIHLRCLNCSEKDIVRIIFSTATSLCGLKCEISHQKINFFENMLISQYADSYLKNE